MKTIQLILAFLLVAGSLTKITPKAPMKKHSMLSGDFFYQPLTEYFDLDEVTYPLHVSGSNAMANNQTTAYLRKHFQVYKFDHLDWVQQVNQDTLVFCYDKKNIVVQIMRGEGKAFGYFQKFSIASADVVCHDTAHYEHRAFLYVGCVSAKSTSTNPGAVYVATWDYEQAKISHIEVTEQKDGFRVLNRLKLIVTDLQSSSTVTPYLVMYDQGNTNAMMHRGNDMVRIYRNVEIGNLKFYKLLSIDDHQFDILYSIFPFQNSLVISGRINGAQDQILQLALCSMSISKKLLSCDPQLKSTTVTHGLIGLTNDGQYYELNSDAATISVADLGNDFHHADWNRNIVAHRINLQLMHNESKWIRNYNGNLSAGVINYGSVGGGPDTGYTGISYESRISWMHDGHAAASIGSSIVFGQQIQV